MGRFEQEFRNYEQYEDVDCYRKTVPNGMADALAERLATVCGADGDRPSRETRHGGNTCFRGVRPKAGSVAPLAR